MLKSLKVKIVENSTTMASTGHASPSHEAGSMQSWNIFLYHSSRCSVAGELMRTVLPSLSTATSRCDGRRRLVTAVALEDRPRRRHVIGEDRIDAIARQPQDVVRLV